MEKILRDIQFLSSKELEGRLSGTVGAKKAAEYLANELKLAGFISAGENGYFSSVDVQATRLMGPARLKIGEQSLKHRVDFAAWSPLSSGGRVSGELITVREGDEVQIDHLAGKIVLIPERPHGFDAKGTIESAADIGIAALLIESGEPRSYHKTVFGSSNNRMPVLRIRRSVVEKLIGLSGATVQIEMPLHTGVFPCNNVLGVLPGRDTSRTLVVSAHYDHLGDDPEGLRFPGTIDNASGVAVMLEFARKLAKGKQELPFNVLVAFFTGEESGLWGARTFLKNPPYPITAAINLDGLGYEPELFALRTGHKEPGHPLADLAASVITRNGIEVKWIAGGDDSVAFIEKGISAIGLGQKPTHERSVTIHTTDDNVEHLHTKPLTQGLAVLCEIVDKLLTKRIVGSPVRESNIN